MKDQGHGGREGDIGGKGGQKLSDRLDLFRERRPQADPDADRNPDQCRQGDQDDHADERVKAVHDRGSDIGPVQRRGDERDDAPADPDRAAEK